MTKKALGFLVLVLANGPAIADDLYELAQTVGEILASEQACQIAIDQEKLKALVRAKVPDTDLRFMRDVDNTVILFPDRLAEMSDSMKAIHCEQMGRLAGGLGISPD